MIFPTGPVPKRLCRLGAKAGDSYGSRKLKTVQLKTSFRVSGQAGATPGGGLQLRCACFASAGSGHETVVLTKYPRLLTLASKCG
ncbi:Uncharacterised protein [Rikenella microfusus]|uniref:Uncharacterized protein n=1 Tax=Rikenella microfusus TaxID=28139 RepID=A0A379MR19_9BACT|nr:Uncharacterised protein [Rikenella microfusus]